MSDVIKLMQNHAARWTLAQVEYRPLPIECRGQNRSWAPLRTVHNDLLYKHETCHRDLFPSCPFSSSRVPVTWVEGVRFVLAVAITISADHRLDCSCKLRRTLFSFVNRNRMVNHVASGFDLCASPKSPPGLRKTLVVHSQI